MGNTGSKDADLLVHQEYMKNLQQDLETYLTKKHKNTFDKVVPELSEERKRDSTAWAEKEVETNSRQTNPIRDDYQHNFKAQLKRAVQDRRVRNYTPSPTYVAFSETEEVEKKGVPICTMDRYCYQPHQCHRRHLPSLRRAHHPQYPTICPPPSPYNASSQENSIPFLTNIGLFL